MIRNPPQAFLDLASAWVTGVAGLFLCVGVGGSFTPVAPPLRLSLGEPASSTPVQVQEFSAPTEEASAEPLSTETLQSPQPVEISIPQTAVVTPPLQPPEMAELQALEPLSDPPAVKPPPETQPPVPVPASVADPKPKSPSPAANISAKTSPAPAGPGRPGGAPGGASQPVPFSAVGGGRFPAPAYPSAARSARIDGTVVLLVTVESSGVPSSVEIRTSSGHTMLDAAARDHLRRNWRWPAGESRLFLVPIKFVLQ
jgi:TonB family protein